MHVASGGGTGSSLARAIIIVTGVSALVASLLSIVWVDIPRKLFYPNLLLTTKLTSPCCVQVHMVPNVRAPFATILPPIAANSDIL